MPPDTPPAIQRPPRLLESAISLTHTGSVPVAPMIYYFAASYAGITMHELWSDWGKYEFAIRKCYEDLGPWDIYYNICPWSPIAYQACLLMHVRYPGRELSPDSICQFLEYEIMTPDDYEWILSRNDNSIGAYPAYVLHMASKFIPELRGGGIVPLARLGAAIAGNFLAWRRHFRWWKKNGVEILSGSMAEALVDHFSMARSLEPFCYDLADRRSAVISAADRLAPSFSRVHSLLTSLTGIPRMLIFVHRSSTDFLSPDMCRTVSFPSLRRVSEALIERGITPILHCDGNWDKSLKLFRSLPAKKCIIQFDGKTDLVRAKQEIGDMHCLFGDVGAMDLVTAGPDQVDEYCHRLIETVGRGGGFILGAGCEIPANARPENVRAMVRAARKYSSPR